MKRKFNVLDGNKDISLTIFRLRVCLCVCVSLCLSESRARVCSLYAVTSSVIFYSTYAQKMMYSVSLNDYVLRLRVGRLRVGVTFLTWIVVYHNHLKLLLS